MAVSVEDIFDVQYGHSLELNRLRRSSSPSAIPFVSRKMGDNGIAAFVKPIADVPPAAAGQLTCALSGNGVLTTHVQDRPFYTGYHVAILKPKLDLTKQQILFYAACIKFNRYRFSYGRQANRTLKKLALPSLNQMPGWVSAAEVDLFANANKAADPNAKPFVFELKDWKPFRLDQLFDIAKGKRVTSAARSKRRGAVPFVGAVMHNNGVTDCIDKAIFSRGTITVVYNGAGVACAFYQPEDYWASDDVNVLTPRFEMTPESALFICAVIRNEKYRFSYGRKWHAERMGRSYISLPCTNAGEIDLDYMSRFIRSLAYSAKIS